MALLKTITNPGGKRPLGWVVSTSNYGNVLVVKRTPKRMAIKTKRSAYVSVNESAANDEAGWALDEPLARALRTYECQKVFVYVPKPGVLFMTDAASYYKPGVVYMVPRTKEGTERIRCVGLEHFTRKKYGAKV